VDTTKAMRLGFGVRGSVAEDEAAEEA